MLKQYENRCLQNCNPTNNPDLDGVNTVVCEQVNFWLGQFKYIMKHMNAPRYNLKIRLDDRAEDFIENGINSGKFVLISL